MASTTGVQGVNRKIAIIPRRTGSLQVSRRNEDSPEETPSQKAQYLQDLDRPDPRAEIVEPGGLLQGEEEEEEAEEGAEPGVGWQSWHDSPGSESRLRPLGFAAATR